MKGIEPSEKTVYVLNRIFSRHFNPSETALGLRRAQPTLHIRLIGRSK